MLIQTLLALTMASSSLASPAASSDTTHAARDARKHTTFGVAIAPVPASFRANDYLEPNEGVVVVQVQRGGAAEAARLQAGDMLLAINGKRVDETTLFATLRDVPRGEKFRVEFLRGARWNETTAVIDP